MDLNVTLQEIRELIRQHAVKPLSKIDVDDLCDLIEALDECLSKGGFLPMRWAWGEPPEGR